MAAVAAPLAVFLALASTSQVQAAIPYFYCAYSCGDLAGGDHAGCSSSYCAATDKQGCALIPKQPPIFNSQAACESFAAQRPRCHKGGSCYARAGPPALLNLSTGFATETSTHTVTWQFGTATTRRQTEAVAVDKVGRNFLVNMHYVTMGSNANITQLLRGAEGRFYTFSSVFGQPSTCTYITVNSTVMDIILGGEGFSFSNYSYLKDEHEEGELTHMFVGPAKIAYARVGFAGETDPEPLPTYSLLLVRASDKRPLRETATLTWAEADWDDMGGVQGFQDTTRFTSFVPGRPLPERFEVPAAWGKCNPAPPSTPQAGALQVGALQVGARFRFARPQAIDPSSMPLHV